jgi:hypothetical protein
MRAPFTALVTSRRDLRFAVPFETRGVSARPVPFDLLTAVLRQGTPIIAEAIVIDGARETSLQGDALTAAGVLANQIRELPGYVTMPNGIRWSRLPIVIVVENDEIRRRAHSDPLLRRVTIASAYPGWDSVYKTVAAVAGDFGMLLVEAYRSMGWRIDVQHGRYVRAQAPRTERRDAKVERIETDLYDGNRDQWYHARGNRTRLPLSLIFTDETAVERDVDELRRKIGQFHPEHVYQGFVDRRTYLLGAAPYELLPQAPLQNPDSGEARYADYSLNRFQLSALDPPSRLVDLKVPQARLLVPARKYHKFGQEIATGIAQLRGYKRDLEDPRSIDQLHRLFANGGTLGPGLLIAGTKANVDRAALEYERELYREQVELQTYDELLENAEQRYLADHRDAEDPYGMLRIGLPPVDTSSLRRRRPSQQVQRSCDFADDGQLGNL